MRCIDLDDRKPTDTDLPGWHPWSKAEWPAWLLESERLYRELDRLNATGQVEERNALIDEHRDHWDKLKPWLSALSAGKCWFTEARDKASHMDVEHFRPKKVAKNLDGTERDGYWWLAFDYTNYRLAGNVPNRMKGGWFPLHRESRCSKPDARCEESETCYLLDPTKQTDVNLLAFDEEGNAIPKPGTRDSWELERLEVSIRRLKLNDHDALPQARRRVWQEMSRAIDSFLQAKSSYRPGINPAPKATMEQAATRIRQMTRPDAELSSVARWCVRFRNDPGLLLLVES
jgi:hypothetical protein